MIYPGNVVGQGDNKPTGQFISGMVVRRMPITALATAGGQAPDMVQ
jgi:hypothetical protein